MELLNERAIKRRLEISIREHGEEHLEVALCFMDLGDKHELDGAWAKAQREYLRASEIFLRLGLDHELLRAIAVKSAAEMARIQNKTDEAKKLKEEARALIRAHCRKDLGANDYSGDAA